ncbi:hypothetical protein RV10_GL000888 [Enterococcus pallens]|nr:hypothetical protein RV10_GL000888 [Enterococcus pallens]
MKRYAKERKNFFDIKNDQTIISPTQKNGCTPKHSRYNLLRLIKN